MDIPNNISAFLHYQRPLLLLISPNLPSSVYSSIWDCFSKLPLYGIIILPAHIFSPWFHHGPLKFTEYFDLPILDIYFKCPVSVERQFNFKMRCIKFRFWLRKPSMETAASLSVDVFSGEWHLFCARSSEPQCNLRFMGIPTRLHYLSATFRRKCEKATIR